MKLFIPVLILIFSSQLWSAFSCGPSYITYKVTKKNTTGIGIRCVKKVSTENGNGEQIFWYGEGNWGTFRYRHVGQAGLHSNSEFKGQAADIYGNGEDGKGLSKNLTIKTTSTGYTVSGDWDEDWTKVTSIDYKGSLGPLRFCGSHLKKYHAYDYEGKRKGRGVRCVAKFNEKTPFWYGEGQWGNTQYAHLGISTWQVTLPQTGLFDICKQGFFCGKYDLGKLTISTKKYSNFATAENKALILNGVGKEIWFPSARSESIRLHAFKVSDIDGLRAPTVDTDLVDQWVHYANSVYFHAGIEIFFVNDSKGPDWATLKHTALNHMLGNCDGWTTSTDQATRDRCQDSQHYSEYSWEQTKKWGNLLASNFPEKVVVYFRRGPYDNEWGGGFSGSDLDFVAMPGKLTSVCGEWNRFLLAHELGHYFDLPHTFTKEFNTIYEASDFFHDHNNNIQAFDLDRSYGIMDTLPDPFMRNYQCKLETNSVIFDEKTYQIPRTNIMSYWHSIDKILSKDQSKVINKTLKKRRP